MGVWEPGPAATAGDDLFMGDATDESADGLAGDDTLQGGEGDDTLEGGLGNDVMDGGAGTDTLAYTTAAGLVTVNLWDGSPQDTGAAGFDTVISIENVIGSIFDDILTGNDGANILHGGDGADLLAGLAGNDSLFGGDGADRLLDDEGDDSLFGGDGGDLLAGGAGNDVLEGGPGDDQIDGGGGIDTASYANAPGAVSLSLGSGESFGAAGHDTLASLENVIGSTFGDTLFGNDSANLLRGETGDDWLESRAGADELFGEAGDDTLLGGVGADVLDGGDGDDRIALEDAGDVDVISGGAGFDWVGFDLQDFGGIIVQLSGYATTSTGTLITTFSGIEAVQGTASDDALIGDAANNLLIDGWGADWLVGGDGDDTFQIRLPVDNNVDRLFGGTPSADSGFDTIDYSRIGGIRVVVNLNGWTTTVGAGTTITLFSGIEAAIASSGEDALIGNASNNRLEGGAGADWLVGGDGDDWFVQGADASIDRLFGGTASADAGIDTIDYSSANAAVTVQLNGWSALAGGATTLATFTGIENAVGSSFADALIGSAANNVLTGGAGADWLVGAGGNDVFVQTIDTTSIDRLFGGTTGADAGLDTIDYGGASQGVVVQLSGYATTNDGANITLATFAGIENAAGSNFADALIGNGSNNALIGRGGADWLVGGAGADAFVYQAVESTRDSIRDFSRAQGDKINLSGIDANPLTGGDDPFIFATTRHGGVAGEAVVTNFGGSSLVSLYIDADPVADMTIQVVHNQSGLVMNAGDFVL